MKLGPYGEIGDKGPRLTDDGRAFLESQLARYDGWPLRLLRKAYPRFAHSVIRQEGPDAVNQDCRYGFLTAALKFEPDLGNAFEAIAAPHVRSAVAVALWVPAVGMAYERLRSRLSRGVAVPTCERVEEYDVMGRSERLTERATAESEREAEAMLANLPPRDRQIVMMRVRDGATYDKIAETMGVTKQRAHQVYERAIETLAGENRE